MCNETFWPLFSRFTYTDIVWDKAPKEITTTKGPKVHFAWFADEAEWTFSFGEQQENSFVPFTWPASLAGLRHHLLETVPWYKEQSPHLRSQMHWNASLVVCLPPGGKWTAHASLRDPWSGRGEIVHEEFCIVHSSPDERVLFTIAHRYDAETKGRQFSMTIPSGSGVSVRNDMSLRQWNYTFENLANTHCFIVVLRELFPMVAGRSWTTDRSQSAIDKQKQIIPSMFYTTATTTKVGLPSAAKKNKK